MSSNRSNNNNNNNDDEDPDQIPGATHTNRRRAGFAGSLAGSVTASRRAVPRAAAKKGSSPASALKRIKTAPVSHVQRGSPGAVAAFQRTSTTGVDAPTSTVARVADHSMMEDSDPFELGGAKALLSTTGSDTNNKDTFVEEPAASSRFGTGRLISFSTARLGGTSTSSLGSTMLADRADRDLRKVDQSINLMAGQYGSGTPEEDDFTTDLASAKRNRSARRQTKRTSVMEILFDSGSTKVNRKSMMAIDLGPDPTKKPRKSIFFQTEPRLVEEPWTMKIQNCFKSICQCAWKVVCSIWFLIVVAVVATCIIFIPRNSGNNDTSKPAALGKATAPASPASTLPAPIVEPKTVEGRVAALQTVFLKAVPTRPQDFEDPESKPSLAVAWLAEFDPLQLSMLDTPTQELVERYALATFFFTTNDAVQPQELSSKTSNAQLRRLQQQAEKDVSLGGWMSSKSICEWDGMRCEKGRLVEFNRTGVGLAGTLPREIMALTDLLELDLSHNLFQGTIPTEGGLPKLKYLLMHDNALTGTLPESIANMTALYDIDLSSNQLEGKLPKLEKLSNLRLFLLDQNKLTGTIGPSIRNLQHLEFLYLADNKLGGELPFEIFSHLKELVDLRLENNLLSGTIPPEIESMHRLEYVKMGKNALAGSLPDVFGRLHYLVELDLHKNEIVGTLPASLGESTTLERIDLSENAIGGSVPAGWANLPNLVSLMLQQNELNGSIPTGDGWRKLRDLWLNGNSLQGSIPDDMGQLTDLVDIILEDNQLEGTLPSTLGNLLKLASLKAYHTSLTGTVPLSICGLRTSGKLKYLATDCLEKVVCSCCDKCL